MSVAHSNQKENSYVKFKIKGIDFRAVAAVDLMAGAREDYLKKHHKFLVNRQ